MVRRILGFLWKYKWRFLASSILLLCLVGIIYFTSFDRALFDSQSQAITFLDRNGKPLRTYFSADEKYSQYCTLSEVSPHFLRAIVLIEDKGFYSHKGIVISSLGRALLQNIKGGRVISGGSTITMQLTKLIYNHRERSMTNKISEIFSALKFELHLSKAQILEHYVNRLPFGNMIYGIKEASQFYFGKKPRDLSLNQAIYLALIPKSPSRYNPAKHLKRLRQRRQQVLKLFKKRNYISAGEHSRAESEGIYFDMKDYPFFAPHFIELVKKEYTPQNIPANIHTTLNLELQQEVEGIIRAHLGRLRNYNVSSGAAIVMDNQSHEIIAYVGSPGYFNDQISGYVDLADSLRQPGSTLKPFVYALALEEGYTPASILPDIKFPSKGGFFPKNHDGLEHGPLRLRVALACSYNIPAFYMAMKLKPRRVIEKLQQAGFYYLKSDPGFYGETIALGSGEVKLRDLVEAYSLFANQGRIYSPIVIKGKRTQSRQVFHAKTAYLIWHILSDPAARFAGFGYDSSMNLPFPVAVKTGTSKGFRDKWALAVNSEFTVGVWIGNPKGDNMSDLSGVGNAATIMRDIFLAVQKDWTRGEPDIPPGLVKHTVCPLSGQLLSSNCRDTVEEYFDRDNPPSGICNYHVREGDRITVKYPEIYRQWAGKTHNGNELSLQRENKKRISFPQQGDFFYISQAVSRQNQVLTFEVMGFSSGEEVQFILDGSHYKTLRIPGVATWKMQPGDHRLSIHSRGVELDTIEFAVR